MPTPEFEEWLERQDIDIPEATEKGRYQEYMAEEYGFTSEKQQEVIATVYEQRIEVLPELGITAVERKYTYRGEPYAETRYAIEGVPGLWGKASAMRIAAERLMERAEIDVAATYYKRYEEALEYGPIRHKRGATE